MGLGTGGHRDDNALNLHATALCTKQNEYRPLTFRFVNGVFDVHFVTRPGLKKDIKSVLCHVCHLLVAPLEIMVIAPP